MNFEDGSPMSQDEQESVFKIISQGKNTASLSCFEELVQLLEVELLKEMNRDSPVKTTGEELVIKNVSVRQT
jgi:hypothetical protein